MSYQRVRESRYSIAPDDELGLTPDDIDALFDTADEADERATQVASPSEPYDAAIVETDRPIGLGER